jgi:AcrR family transcriptional regulator
MARRSDHSRDELYNLAMTAARDIVRREGMAALTARGLATAIGYSPGTLYNLFDSLDELALQNAAASTPTRGGRRMAEPERRPTCIGC